MSGKLVDITGQKFNMLTAIKFIEIKNKQTIWEYKCDCGVIKHIIKASVCNANTQSCGCLYEKNLKTMSKTHGQTKRKEYKIYHNMINKCYNKNVPSYKYYGARGITVQDSWIDNPKAFLDYIRTRPSKLYRLERIDKTGNFEEANIKWIKRIKR